MKKTLALILPLALVVGALLGIVLTPNVQITLQDTEVGLSEAHADLDQMQRRRVRQGFGHREFSDDMADNVFDIVDDVAYTISQESSNRIDVAMDFRDLSGGPGGEGSVGNVDELTTLYCYASDDSACDSITATALQTSLLTGTNGSFQALVTGKSGYVMTNTSNGKASLRLTSTSNISYYMCCVTHDGKVDPSAVIDFN